MKSIAQAIVVVGLALVGVTGLYFKVEYSGWVLFIGLVAAFNLV